MNNSFFVDKKSIFVSYVTQFFQYCVNILILPIILATVDSTTLGIWYLFLSVSSLVMLLDFGFSTSLSKNVSYVFGGAQKIIKDGCITNPMDNSIDYNLLNSIIYTTKLTYRRISSVMLFFLLTLGTFYIYKTTNKTDYLLIWLFFSFSITINYYYNYINIFIKGRGMILLSNRLIILTKLIYVVVIFVLLWLKCGLWALVVANFVGAFTARLIGRYFFWDIDLKENLSKVRAQPENLFPILWYNAKRMGITGITNYAYSQASVLISGLFLSLTEVAQLGLCIQLFTVVVTLSRVYLNTYYPQICSLWISDSIGRLRKLFLKAQLINYIIFFTGCITIIFYGIPILHIFRSQTVLPNQVILSIFAFFYFMEVTHGNCAILISSNNRAPFYKADIVACITTIVVVLILLRLNFGLYSFPIGMCCGSLPYNSWKWVVVCFNMLNPKAIK